MRELGFRAYIKPLKRYATGLDTIQFHKCCDVAGPGIWTVVTLNEGIFEGDEIIIEQDTGLKDKNGKEIYEGDIVDKAYHNLSTYDKKGVVMIGELYDSDGWCNGTILGWCAGGSSLLDVCKDCTVIGNIHENPELIA